MRRLALAALIAMSCLLSPFGPTYAQSPSPCRPTGPITPDAMPSGGWVGSSFEGFEALYGKSSSTSPLFNEYKIDGCGDVMVTEHDGIITGISLYAPRAEGKDYRLESDDADWNLEYAIWIAQSFLPPDATFTQDVYLSSIDDWHQVGFSQLLLDSVPATVYEYVSHTPVYGGFQVWYVTPMDGSKISMIMVQLQIEDVD